MKGQKKMNLNIRTIGFSAALLVLIGVAFAGTEARIALGTIALVGGLFTFLCLAGRMTPHPERGGVTVTYKFPVSGTVAPTAAQMQHINTVRGNVIATLDADTTATITTNFGNKAQNPLTAAQLLLLQPEVTLAPLLAQFYTSVWTFARTDVNTVTATKGTAGGSGNAGAQMEFVIHQPSTLMI